MTDDLQGHRHTPFVEDDASQRGVEPVHVGMAVFDVHTLRGIVGDDPAVLVEIVAYFDSVAGGLRGDLLRAAAAADAREASRIAHSLKSSARSVGALQLGERCAALEAFGIAGGGPGGPLPGRVAGVVEALDAALAAMRDWLGLQAHAAQG